VRQLRRRALLHERLYTNVFKSLVLEQALREQRLETAAAAMRKIRSMAECCGQHE